MQGNWIVAPAAVLLATAATASVGDTEPFTYSIHRVSTVPLPGTPVPAPERFDEDATVKLIVLTDIGNEPDDSESLVRLLLYTNELDLVGLVATTSASQPDRIHPELLHERIAAYGSVLKNLRGHDPRYPSAQSLTSIVREGSRAYGLAGTGPGKSTPGSDLIIKVVDAAGTTPVWVAVWGGAADLAQALHDVRTSRSEKEVEQFVSRLRVFSISDQDDAGPIIRHQYPQLFWIASIHAFRDYAVAGWTGISRDLASPSPAIDTTLVDHAWQKKVQAMGPLGALYPLSSGLMEGDTPSVLGLVPNGLNVPARPDYGGWGGRYGKVSGAFGLYADASDTVKGRDGSVQRTPEATIWRWREAVQNDFLARLRWSLTPDRKAANHAPLVMINGQGGLAPLVLHAHAGTRLSLSAAGTVDPDGDGLSYRWWQYREPTFTVGRTTRSIVIEGNDSQQATALIPSTEPFAPTDYHIVLEVTDAGSPHLTRYRRVIVKIDP